MFSNCILRYSDIILGFSIIFLVSHVHYKPTCTGNWTANRIQYGLMLRPQPFCIGDLWSNEYDNGSNTYPCRGTCSPPSSSSNPHICPSSVPCDAPCSLQNTVVASQTSMCLPALPPAPPPADLTHINNPHQINSNMRMMDIIIKCQFVLIQI